VFSIGVLTVLFLFGLVQLVVGYLLGRTVAARQVGGHYQAIMERLRDSSKRTTRLLYGVREEISKHREEIGQINRELTSNRPCAKSDNKIGDEKNLEKVVVRAISKIVDVNRQLDDRLSRAENQMKEQADQLNHQLNEARTDPLTGLANRRAFDAELRQRLILWNQEQHEFSLVLIDVDFFKKVNDQYGHPAGDAVLCDLAELLRRTFDDHGFPARIGGEEFAVILPNVEPPRLFQVMELLHNRVNQSATKIDGETICVTISMGMVTARNGDSADSLVKRADLALYDAKHAGRNTGFFSDGRMSYKAVPCRAADQVDDNDSTQEMNASIQIDRPAYSKEDISIADDSSQRETVADMFDRSEASDCGNAWNQGVSEEMTDAEDAIDGAKEEMSPAVSALCGDVRRRLVEIVSEEPRD